MRYLALLALAASCVRAADPAHWAKLAASSKDGVIKLDSASYDALLAEPREYAVTIVLTAMPAQFKCQPCQEFNPSFHTTASSWKRLSKDKRDSHFFGELDFADGQAVYSRLGLSTAPTVQFHPATTGPNKGNKLEVISYDLGRNGLSAPPFTAWVSSLAPHPFELHVPFNPVPYVALPLLSALSAYVLYMGYPLIVPVLQSKTLWTVVSLFSILVFTSGHMWNKIKGTPYIAIDREGRTSWIASGYQNQLGLETQVVATMYGLLSFSVVALTLLVPALNNPHRQRIGVYLWLGIFVIVFSALVKLFKMKNGGYPFKLLF